MTFAVKAGGYGPSYRDLRPLHPDATSATFPVYSGLPERLLTAHSPTPAAPDSTVSHVLATAAGYAYGDQATVAMMMTRLGLERARCVMVRQVVDAMFISSTAYVVQSEDGRVVLLCYRGTEPANLISWLTDIDVDPDQVHYDLTSPEDPEPLYRIHAGFYRNVRATRYAVIDLLQRSAEGKSILDDSSGACQPMEALYITGHSLGGAMAALMTVMLRTEDIYAELASTLKATYTFGQPMIGTRPFAEACNAATFDDEGNLLNSRVFRYIYADDVVPQLPPKESDEFAHFGQEFRCGRLQHGQPTTWNHQKKNIGQTTNLGLVIGGLALLTRQEKRLRWLRLHQSIADHGPQHYISALTPPGVRSEFGD